MILYAAETILYLTFLGMDIFGLGNTTPLKFLSILLLTLSVLDFREKTVTIALAFTAAADVFLLLLDRYYEAGILCFIAVYGQTMDLIIPKSVHPVLTIQ